MGRPSKKNSKQYISRCKNLLRMDDATFENFRKEKQLARDVAGVLRDVVNNIAILQTPSTDHPHTLHSTNSAVGSPSDCSTYRSVATQTYFEEIFDPPKLRPREAKINGRRIIEKSGICTSYNLKCLVCNFEKEISSESPYRDTNLNALVRKLVAMKRRICPRENIQREHQLTITTQQCSSVSDNSNIQRESQLTTMKQSSSAHENLQKKFQLTTLEQNSSAHKNIQREPQLATMKQSSSAHENIQREHKLTTTQQCSSTSDNSNLFQQVHSYGLSVEDEFEIKEENVTENENEFETMMPYQTTKTSNSKLIAGREQVILNTITVKQEIDSDDENSNKSIAKETTNKKSVMVFVNAEQIGAMLTQANEGRACENTMVVNEEKIHLQKNVMVDNNMLGKPEFYDMELKNKESVTDFDNKPDSESPLKKARTVTYKESNNSDTQGTPTTASNKEINVFQNRFESNRLATSATKSMRNGTATSNITNVRNATATISVTKAGGEKVTFSIPVKFNENGALIIPQNPHDKASGTYQGVNGTASMPGIPSAMQQPASIPNANGATCVPLKSAAVQPTVSSNAMPKVWDGSKKRDALGQDGQNFLVPRAKQKNIFLDYAL